MEIVAALGENTFFSDTDGVFTTTATLLLASPLGPVHASVYVRVAAVVGVIVLLPLIGCAPLQSPLAVQEVTLRADQVRAIGWPTYTLVALVVSLTVGGAGVTVRGAEAVVLPPMPLQVTE